MDEHQGPEGPQEDPKKMLLDDMVPDVFLEVMLTGNRRNEQGTQSKTNKRKALPIPCSGADHSRQEQNQYQTDQCEEQKSGK
jgi:hypothetical protein